MSQREVILLPADTLEITPERGTRIEVFNAEGSQHPIRVLVSERACQWWHWPFGKRHIEVVKICIVAPPLEGR